MPPKTKPSRISKTVGANIQAAREQRGWSREELGQQVNLTRIQIYKYELGQSRISVDVFVRICAALGSEIEDLLEGDLLIR